MTDDSNLRVKITADDKASAAIDALRQKMDRLLNPAARAGKGFAGVSRQTTALDRFSKGQAIPTITTHFTKLSQASFAAFKNVGRLSAEFGGLGALAPTAGFLGALGGAVALTKQWADQGMRLKNTAANLGMNPGAVARFRREAAMVGVSGDSAVGALGQLQRDAFNARVNRDPGMVQAFQQLGISLTDANGQPMAPAALLQRLAGVVPRLSPAGQQVAMGALGLSPDILPLLRKGPDWIAQQGDALKSMMPDSAYAGADQLYQDFQNLDTAAISLTNTLAKGFEPAVDDLVKSLTAATNWLSGSDKSIGSWLNWLDPSAGKDFGSGALPNPAEAFGRGLRDRMLGMIGLGPVAAASATGTAAARQKQAMDYFVSQGWTPAQAAGIVGNIRGESSFDPAASNGNHWGLGQWDMARRTAIYNATGIDVASAGYDAQLKAYQWELQNSESAAGSALKGATTAAQAADIIRNQFERPGYDPANQALREGYATSALSAYGAPPVPIPGAATGGGAATDGKVTIDITHSNVPAGVSTSVDASGSASLGTMRVNKAMTPAEALP